MNTLTWGMICDRNDKQCRKKYPRMKLKAHETVKSMEAILALWKEKMQPGNQKHIWVKLGLEASVNMDKILKEHCNDWNLSPPVFEELWKNAVNYVITNAALWKHFQEENRCLFQSGTFKSHWLLHAVKLAKFINPRYTWAYSGESYMHTMKVLMQACLTGRGSLQSVQKFMMRYVNAVTLDLRGMEWRLR